MREGVNQEVGQRTTGAKALKQNNLVLLLEQREGEAGQNRNRGLRGTNYYV